MKPSEPVARMLYTKHLWEVPEAQAVGQVLRSPVASKCLTSGTRLLLAKEEPPGTTLIRFSF